MRYYTESFKIAVVKKVLTPGVIYSEVCRKLNISTSAVRVWRKQYGDLVQNEVETDFLDSIQFKPVEEEEVDIDKLLAEYDRKDLSRERKDLEQSIDRILERGKLPTQYAHQEKYLLVRKYRQLSPGDQGMFLRKAGLRSDHITLWEEDILTMGKKEIDKNAYIKQVEAENKALQKKIKELERDKKELEIIVELKKKYPHLFKGSGDD